MWNGREKLGFPSKRPRISEELVCPLLDLARKQLGVVVAVDFANERVVVQSFRIHPARLRTRGLLQDELDRFGIDGHVFVPDLHAFLITLVQKFRVGDFAALSENFPGVGRIVEAALYAVEIAYQKYLESVGVLLHKGARNSRYGYDNFEPLFKVVDNDRKSFSPRHFVLGLRDYQLIGVAL